MEYEYISLAIIHSVSLRLQNEGQKNSRIAPMHTESLTRIFLTFVFLCIGILNGFASVTTCGWFLTTNLPNPTNIYHVTTYKIRPIRAISVRKKIYSRMNNINLTTNPPNQTNHLICRLNQKKNPSIIPFVLSRHNQNETKIKKKKIKKRIRVKTPLKICDVP